jgi:hypothetical protein
MFHVTTEYVPPQLTLGIDLAAQPRDTAYCLIDWSAIPAQLVDWNIAPATDEMLLGLMADPRVLKVGIDAPLGWPLAFIDAVSTYRDAGTWLEAETNELRFRATETVVAQETGQNPLSVAMSDLAWAAMRCARLATELGAAWVRVDRTGAGRIAKVYPGAALRRWGLIEAGPVAQSSYKGDVTNRRQRREIMMDKLGQRLEGSCRATAGRCHRLRRRR